MEEPSSHPWNKNLGFDFLLIMKELKFMSSIFLDNILTSELETILQHSAEATLL